MPTTLLIIYRILALRFLHWRPPRLWKNTAPCAGGGAAACPRAGMPKGAASNCSPNRSAGGYRYLVELHANGQRLELETNESFAYDKTVGKAIQVWYNPNARCVERKSWETEIFSAVLAVIEKAPLLI